MRNENREVALVGIQRAEAMINELNVSLEMTQGDISTQLALDLPVLEAAPERGADRARPGQDRGVCRLLAELREAWDQVAGQAAAAGEARRGGGLSRWRPDGALRAAPAELARRRAN